MDKQKFVYQSNPITLLIEGVTRLFNRAQTLGITLIVVPFISGTVQFIVQLFSDVFGNTVDSGREASPVMLGVGIVLFVVTMIFSIFLQTMISGLSALTGAMVMSFTNRSIGDALADVLDKFWRVLGVTVMVALYTAPYVLGILALVAVNIAVGVNSRSALAVSIPASSVVLIFFIVMMIRVTLRYAIAQYALFHENLGVMAALARSKQLTKKRLIEFFAVRTLGSLVPFVNLALVVGAETMLYEQLEYAEKHKLTPPKPSVGNYVVLYCIIGILLLIALSAAAIVLIARNAS